jgi:hypothetical protein
VAYLTIFFLEGFCARTKASRQNFLPKIRIECLQNAKLGCMSVDANVGECFYYQRPSCEQVELAIRVLLDSVSLTSVFCAVYTQRRSLFSPRTPLLDTACFGLTGHLQVYRLLWFWIPLLPATTIGGNKTALQ